MSRTKNLSKQKSQARSQKSLPAVKSSVRVQAIAPTPDNMIMIALNTGRSMEEIKALIDMRNAEIARLARIEFLEAKQKFISECPPITKNKKNGEGQTSSYWFAELQHVENIVKDPLTRNGFSWDWKTRYEDNKIYITCILSHKAGHSETDTMRGTPDTSGKKNVIQSESSTVSYLRRYTLLGVLGKATGGDDNDGFGGAREPHQPQQVWTVLPKPSQAQMNEAATKIAAGKMTVEDAEQMYTLSDEQLETLRLAAQ